MLANEGSSTLMPKDFAVLFGLSEDEIVEYCRDILATSDFRYRRLEGDEQDQLVLKVLKALDSNDLPQAGKGRHADWEKGWNENLAELIDSKYDLATLVPKYFKKHGPLRLNRSYILPSDNDFLFNMTRMFRNSLFQKYLREFESIYEFGCGAASHLAYLAGLYPDKNFVGFDWARSSQEIIRQLSQRYGWSMHGGYFDFVDPDISVEIDQDGAVYTFAALEQLGKDYGVFLDFILKKSPRLCINVECLDELYDDQNLFDYLALKYHHKRNYLNGYLSTLRDLEKDGRIQIIKIHRQFYGNLFDDPHSYVVWRPVVQGREKIARSDTKATY